MIHQGLPMLFIVASGVIGAAAALIMLWPYGALTAVFGAPFGGGLFAALAAMWLARRAAADHERNVPMAAGDKVAEDRVSRMKESAPPE